MNTTTLQAIESYLNKYYRINTIHGIMNDITNFIKWCEEENLTPEKTTYNELLSYIRHRTAQGNKKQTINQKLGSIKHYYNYLISNNQRDDNPTAELRLKNQTYTVPVNILPYEALENLYTAYPATGIAGKRNKCVLGLMIYQGLNTAELQALEVKDIKLEEGKIYIPGVSRSNDRLLKLQAHQIMPLQNYVLNVRPVILAMSEKTTDKLFTSYGSGSKLSNSFTKMLTIIRKINPNIKDQKQIRASVIANWYKHYNTRQVQYMAGHRYVSSTERYRTDKLESLQEQLERMHPIQ